MFILKNAPDEYILFNSKKKTKTVIIAPSRVADKVRYLFELTVITPMQYCEMELNKYREIWLDINN